AFAESSAESARQSREYVARVGQRANAQFQSDMARHQSRMNSFEAQQQAKSANAERWQDYALDRQKVVNPNTGEVSKQANTTYHYQRGNTIINTNDPVYSPGPNWTPLQNAQY